MKKVIVIGAGASGLVSAVFARKAGNDVIVLEKNDICGKKILATGNGRCNFWNEDQSINHYRGTDIQKIKRILNYKNQEKIKKFFKEIGIEPKIKNGYYYPYSNQAISMQKALILENEKRNVKIKINSEVIDIKKEKEKFKITLKNGDELQADKVILAVGSKAAPKTGSDGFGYKICKKLGLKIIEPLPALVQLKAEGKFLKQWEGIRADGKIDLYENGKKIGEEKGEIQLTNYGISGICVFNLSGRVSRGLKNNKTEEIKINFLDGLNINNEKQFIDWMNERNSNIKNRTIIELLEGVLNPKLIKALLSTSYVDLNSKWEKLNEKEKNKISQNIINFRLNITGTNSFDKSQVCSGGISLDEIDEKTMEVNKIKGLYITGETLDVDGDCGGYNLEWAWITGMIAGGSNDSN